MEKLCINCNRYLDESMFPLRKGGNTSNICSECEAKRKKKKNGMKRIKKK